MVRLEDLQEEHFSTGQVAEMLGMTVKGVYSWHRTGKLRGFKIGGQIRFFRSEIEAFLERSQRSSATV